MASKRKPEEAGAEQPDTINAQGTVSGKSGPRTRKKATSSGRKPFDDAGKEAAARPAPSSPDPFKSILSVLHARTRYDFRHHKKATLERRIQRRMALGDIDEPSDYLGLLHSEPEEVEALFKDLLIGVTRFFREPGVWMKLEAEAVRPVIAAKSPGETLRVWVPGCSTGEEAYSIAILIQEELERQNKELDLRLFATDLDEDSIKTARTGSYPPDLAPDVGEERLRRFFTEDGERFRANKQLRQSCVFAVQNLLSDPPLSDLDLISCRNLLIYLKPGIRRKLIRLFHFALRPGGHLFLGPSESVTRGNHFFSPVAKDAGIYRRRDGDSGGETGFPVVGSRPARGKKRPLPGGMPAAEEAAGDARPTGEDSALRQQLGYELHATRQDLQSMIEELQSANEELKEREQRLRRLADAIPVLVAYVDRDFTYRYCNARYREWFGLGQEEIVGRSLADILGGETVHELEPHLRKVMNGESLTFEAHLPYRHGPARHVRVHYIPNLRRGKEVIGFHAMIEDIAEQVIGRTIRRRQAAIVENSHDPIIGHDLDGVIISWNAAAERVSGYPAEEAVGRPIEILMPEDRCGELRRILDQVRRGEPVPDLETVCRHKDGRRLDVQFTVSPITDRKNRVVAASTIIHDLSERKRTELALLQSEEQLKMAQDAAGIGIYDWDIPGDSIRWDARVREFWGVSGEEPIGYETFIEGLHPDDRGPAEAAIKRALDPQGPGIFTAEYRVIHRQRGSTCWLAATGKVSFEDQRPVRLVGMVQDITKRREAELRLEAAAERLEEQVAERTAIAEEKAADLRELACQITNAEQRARRKLARLIHDDLQQLLVAAKMRLPEPDQMATPEELESIAGILDQVLTKSRMMVSELSPPILREGTFTDALSWLARWMEENHRLKVETQLDDELEGISENLRTLLFSCLRELLFNAAKHADTPQAWMKVTRVGNDLHVEVKDHGKGFDPGNIQPRSDSFGLFNTRERIEACGGRMKIESAPGKGARFRITVPLTVLNGEPSGSRDPHQWGARQARRLMPAGGVVRVLLADDHKMVREGIARILSANPRIEVIGEASDGEEAIELARLLQPHAVLMDISMPRLNGIEATRQICEEMPEVVVIGLSLHDRAELGEAIIHAGASDFLKKDVPAGILMETLLSWFGEVPAGGPDSGRAVD